MGRPLKIKESATVDVGFNNPAGGQYYGVVGGDTDLSVYAHPVVKIRVKITGQSEADGYIIRQKGATKYLVSDGTNTGVCVLANLADGNLTDATMTVTVTDSGSSEFRLKRFTNRWGLDFSDARYLLNFFEVAASVTKSGGEAATFSGGTATVELVQVDNPNLYG